MLIKTIQNKRVLDTLKNGQTYYAKPTQHDSLKPSYDRMMKHYNWKNNPIFGCVVDRYSDFYGAELDDSVILTIDVPDDIVKLQVYYDWTDLIYYMKNSNIWKKEGHPYDLNTFIKNTLDGHRTEEPDAIIQATMPYIKPESLIESEPITKEFINKYYNSHKCNVLK